MPKLRTLKILFVLIMSSTLFCVFNWTSTKTVVRDLIYLTRPIWDGSNLNFTVIPHYYTDGLNSTQLCNLHNWKHRTSDVQVIDAIIFSVELDLLEIRFKELWPFIDHFVVLEADKTFTGRPKRLLLNETLDRFSWAKDKLRYHSYSGLEVLKPGQNPFKNEGQMREHMDNILSKYAKTGDIIICSDVDEIPSAQTVQLLKECTGYPQDMHLQLNMYLYSFEYFFSTDDSWRAHISIYDKEFHYQHGHLSGHLLADSGWHCSFCFRYIHDFVFKMTSYSHNDRVLDQKLLTKEEIQRRICNGEDVYDMYPEVYSFREMVLKFGPIAKSKVMTNLPKHLIQNPQKFAFLLPNGCIREDFNSKPNSS